MINGKSVLALIPARGGSKGIPGKNIKILAGKPMLAWTIEAAKQSKYIDRLILSSDDEKIMAVAEEYDCEVPFQRPDELAQDDTSGVAPILHALATLDETFDYVVLLQPTSPLRQTEDIDKCIELCVEKQAVSCVTVSEVKENPNLMFTIEEKQQLKRILCGSEKYNRRQDFPVYYTLNGAVYVMQCKWLQQEKKVISGETIASIMPRDRAVDIDELLDFIICEWLLSKKLNLDKGVL